jgi:hypothetical protein
MKFRGAMILLSPAGQINTKPLGSHPRGAP